MSDNSERPIPFTSAHAQILTDIHNAIKGDHALGTVGLAQRVKHNEEAHIALKAIVETHDRKVWFISVIAGAAWVALVEFKDLIFNRHP